MELPIPEYIAILTAAVALYYHQEYEKPIDTQPDDLLQVYDFIIVGAGSAGCVVANRLSEVGEWTVLLIEAGGDENALSDTPFTEELLYKTEFDWNYTTVEQNKACRVKSGKCVYTRGRVLGGSSAINGMMYVRGNRKDFDEWCAKGNSGWSYNDVLPYFKKSESASDPLSDTYHGKTGPVSVQYSHYISPLAEKVIEAGKQYGLDEVDYNGRIQHGIGITQSTMKGRSRASTSKSYLNPIRDRKNLHISKHSQVLKVDIDPSTKRALGVLFVRGGTAYKVKAAKEVILSAGSINSPQLLMLSGIGPKEHLESFGIQVIADQPVGENLQDHLVVPLQYGFDAPLTIKRNDALTNESIMNYAVNGTGFLTAQRLETTAFLNVYTRSCPPNVQLIFNDSPLVYRNDKYDYYNIATCLATNIHPKSRGSVKLSSSDPLSAPLIDPNYLEVKRDLKTTKLGLKALMEIMATPVMQSLGAKLLTQLQPKCEMERSQDKYLECVIAEYSGTIYHPVGSAKMGPKWDKSSVVSPTLIVQGFSNLRVIDASIMPSIVRGNPNAAVIMIGEKGADLIKSSY